MTSELFTFENSAHKSVIADVLNLLGNYCYWPNSDIRSNSILQQIQTQPATAPSTKLSVNEPISVFLQLAYTALFSL
jgi:hypothetical protein